MSNLDYKRTVTTNLKVAGILNTKNMTIEVNGEEKRLSTLFSDYDKEEIEINIKTKEQIELDLPEEDEAM